MVALQATFDIFSVLYSILFRKNDLRGKGMDNFEDDLWDGLPFEPTPFIKKLWSWGPIWRFRQWCQASFRRNGLSDSMVWNAHTTMSEYCYKVLLAYKKSERGGYPSVFQGYEERQNYMSKEEYEEKIKSGEFMGGGENAWEATLDHIIMALEYHAIRDTRKYGEWFVRYFGMDPHEENNKCNEYIDYEYRDIGEHKSIACTWSSQKPDPSKVEWCTEKRGYYNGELAWYAEGCVQYGLELLGRFWTQMWD